MIIETKLENNPELEKLLTEVKSHVITPEEHEAQRQSWARGQWAGEDRHTI